MTLSNDLTRIRPAHRRLEGFDGLLIVWVGLITVVIDSVSGDRHVGRSHGLPLREVGAG
jgi:hypothetical protein